MTLDAWIGLRGCTAAWIARKARISAATVMRARRGQPVQEASARALSRVTGIPSARFRLGERDYIEALRSMR